MDTSPHLLRESAAATGRVGGSNRTLRLHVGIDLPEGTRRRITTLAPGIELTYHPNSPYEPASGQAPFLAEAEVVLGYHPFDPAQAPNLRWLQVAGDGVDHLRGSALFKSDLLITNTRLFGIPIAEYVIGSIIAFFRDFPRMHARFQVQRQWPTNQWTEYAGQELAGKTLAILGYGEIGHRLARLAHAFDMRVLATRHSATERTEDQHVAIFPAADTRAVLSEADVVVVCLPLTDETDNSIGEPELRSMKPTAYLVTVGRGGVVHEPALVQALRDGWIAGAGLDVYARKPLPVSSPFFDLPNVIMTPHMSGITREFHARMADFFCAQLRHYLDGAPLLYVVDKRKGY